MRGVSVTFNMKCFLPFPPSLPPSLSLPLSFSISQHRVTSVAVNKTGEWLAFGCSSLGQLLVWEWQSETYILKQQGHFYDINTLSYSPDGQTIATGGDDGKVGLVRFTAEIHM